MSDAPQSPEKKIIIDEDWKSQVRAEKEAAQKPPEAAPPERGEPLPPPDLIFLASSLYLQGMVSLGLLPNPVHDKLTVQLSQAKHSIDTLQMLYDKTTGNRTPEETDSLDDMLHDLRLAFIAVQQKVPEQKGKKPDGIVP